MQSITIKSIAACAVFTLTSGLIYAQTVKVEGAWVRVAVPGQSGTGGFMRLTAEFYVRGGIYTTVVAEHRAPGWSSPQDVRLP